MRFVKIGAQEATKAAGEQLVTLLRQHERVLWLISGGSNIQSEVGIARDIPDELRRRLAIMPVDERYVPVDHEDSNLVQLIQAGYRPEGIMTVPVLAPNLSLQETATRYAGITKLAFENAGAIVAQLGMGSDGHIAGIKPDSPAVDAHDWAVGYEWDDYRRLTLTVDTLKKVHHINVFAYGKAKREQLLQLRDQNLPAKTQPAQLLRDLQDVVIYNDQIEGV